jgi:multidrug efflux pump subunit AcrB
LYESWSIPLAVLLSLPLGLFGALLAVYLRNYPYDVYTQIGIVTLIGLAAKNAILIVEFAKDSHENELMPVREAALHAAKLRLRPILMTSFAFILGVVPLFVATGAGAASRDRLEPPCSEGCSRPRCSPSSLFRCNISWSKRSWSGA